MTVRFSSALAAVLLLSTPAAAQTAMFAEGVKELVPAMMTGDTAHITSSIDKMEAALAVWKIGDVPPAGTSLLGDETAEIPALPLAAYAEGFARLRRGEYRDAVVALRHAAAVTEDERAQLFDAGTLAQQGRDVEAEWILRSIIDAFPQSGVAHWWLARIDERLNRISDARREYEQAVSIALSGRASLYAAIGRLSHTESDFPRATAAYERRLQLSPTDPAAHKDLARIHREQGRTDQALALLTAAVALDPLYAEAHAEIGWIRLDTGQPAEAIAALRRALDLMPAMFEVRYALATALRQTGQAGEAAKELALFERERREVAEERRRTMAAEVQREGEARQDAR
jgi:tetratricopeptide (TPR) repeat protein